MSAPLDVADAARGMLAARVAKRDAYRLLVAGYLAAIRDPDAMIDAAREAVEAMTMTDAIVLQAASIAKQMVDLYDTDPEQHPEGRNAETAWACGLRVARSGYTTAGRCRRCKGPALACARHGATHDEGCANL